ncbi:hypothetical protein KUTeg_023207 [Tegillarca granosa]|uniref:Uncharacterized protein n=1 Tax=Tegillarca granosa TaxID=220873 RepID=A0ABQ9E5I1_TEGGR|nr:hypothetical protein KUTeg_023207 [Tegillarca granosa]
MCLVTRYDTPFMDTTDMSDEEELLDPKDKEQQLQWEREFRKRTADLFRQQQRFEQRRQMMRKKMKEINIRWQNLELRRETRAIDHLERLASNLDKTDVSTPTQKSRSRSGTRQVRWEDEVNGSNS